MLVISIPNDETAGKCRINGQPCDFEIEGHEFRFRYEGQADWDRRTILNAARGPKLTNYACSNQGGGGGVVYR